MLENDFVYCPSCGVKNDKENKFCKNCGGQLDDHINVEHVNAENVTNDDLNDSNNNGINNEKVKGNTLFGVLSFLFPIIGVILSIVLHFRHNPTEQDRADEKICLKWALISIIVSVVICVICWIIAAAVTAAVVPRING